jgi:hypothetical protein
MATKPAKAPNGTAQRNKAANAAMGQMMNRKVTRTVQMREQTNKGAKRN